MRTFVHIEFFLSKMFWLPTAIFLWNKARQNGIGLLFFPFWDMVAVYARHRNNKKEFRNRVLSKISDPRIVALTDYLQAHL